MTVPLLLFPFRKESLMPQQHTGRQFKADHACRLIESRDEDNNGPAREAWKCDNDVVYVKNID
ncbi:hypothetical protein DKJ00_17670 [Salmonella enterica subsp. enterica serovar Typhimurium]|nr:hypothetical protein [Salmonella enterica]EBU6494793.1 hypothetical protein [Salmonella enterica subsp. enterica serovar Typhimurium]EBX2258005.1 hypothetical protein [Salmonella enterica subsp. enterica serovar Enteritidis]EBY7213220.1 hypothetical protein [Salmonella enterica subsp. enterica serovar Reading]EDP9289694.1 hypothetical protein [Salmonella enterica subsp. enterica serovar Javiana]EEY0194475.1 hypothetical protein [Escherichia coli]